MAMVRRWAVAVVVGLGVASFGTVVGCGSGDDQTVGVGGAPSTSDAPAPEGPFPLPFGIEQPAGLEPIGRPIDYVHTGFWWRDVPVEMRSLRAAFRVTADDPPAVLRAFIEELDGMTLHEGYVGPGEPHDPELWMQARAMSEFVPDRPGGTYAAIELWATDGDPILLVSLSQNEVDAPTPLTITRDTGDGHRPTSVLADRPRGAGDVLFVEQGDTVHLPPGTRALMPTVPTSSGTGGSTSLLAADDGEAAVQALLDEGQALNDFGDVRGPETTEVDGTIVTVANFTITAGGWGFDVVARRDPGDPYATVHVSSFAD